MIAVTNVGHYADPSHLTGLWLTKLTHALEVFQAPGSSKVTAERVVALLQDPA